MFFNQKILKLCDHYFNLIKVAQEISKTQDSDILEALDIAKKSVPNLASDIDSIGKHLSDMDNIIDELEEVIFPDIKQMTEQFSSYSLSDNKELAKAINELGSIRQQINNKIDTIKKWLDLKIVSVFKTKEQNDIISHLISMVNNKIKTLEKDIEDAIYGAAAEEGRTEYLEEEIEEMGGAQNIPTEEVSAKEGQGVDKGTHGQKRDYKAIWEQNKQNPLYIAERAERRHQLRKKYKEEYERLKQEDPENINKLTKNKYNQMRFWEKIPEHLEYVKNYIKNSPNWKDYINEYQANNPNWKDYKKYYQSNPNWKDHLKEYKQHRLNKIKELYQQSLGNPVKKEEQEESQTERSSVFRPKSRIDTSRPQTTPPWKARREKKQEERRQKLKELRLKQQLQESGDTGVAWHNPDAPKIHTRPVKTAPTPKKQPSEEAVPEKAVVTPPVEPTPTPVVHPPAVIKGRLPKRKTT